MFDLTRVMMLLAVVGTSTVLGVWLGYWIGVGVGKDAQSRVDAVKWAARLAEMTRQKQELWYQLQSARRAWRIATVGESRKAEQT